MPSPPQTWLPVPVTDLSRELPGFDDWVLQVMVFDDEGDEVVYRRDRRIRWPKCQHSVAVVGLRVLNPFITFLFKANQTTLEEKEIHDLIKLIGIRTES
jgi:hypothetical protein